MEHINNSITGAALSIGVDPVILNDSLHILRCGIKMSEVISDNSKLLADKARLTKAGDAMHEYLKQYDGTTNGEMPVRADWTAAKGVQL